MTWFWLTFPLASLFFLAATVIPPWLVIKDPDTRRKTSGPARRAADRTFAAPVPVQAVNSAASAAWPQTPEAARTDCTARQQELVGSASG